MAHKFLILLIIKFLIFSLGGSVPAHAIQPGPVSNPDFARIDRYLQSELKAIGVPGAQLVIIHGNQIVHQLNYGQADPGGRAVTSSTPFLIGSETKSITALAVAQLVEQRKVRLDDPLQTYLPWFHVLPPDGYAGNQSPVITIRELLDHSSGISAVDGVKLIDQIGPVRPDSLLKQAQALSGLKLSAVPGTRYQYSNANYDLLGLVVQVASGQPYADYVQHNIFAPLEMSHSSFTPAEAEKNGVAAGYQAMFGIAEPRSHLFTPGFVASGTLTSMPASDLAHLLIAEMNGGEYDGHRVIGPQGLALLLAPGAPMQAPGGKSQGLSSSYNAGWIHLNLGSVPVLAHSGETFTAHASMTLAPDQGYGVVLLMNESNFFWLARQDFLSENIMSLLLGQPVTAINLPTDTYLILAFLLVILLLFTVLAARRATRWLRNPQSRPHAARPVINQALLPLVIFLGYAYLVMVNLVQTVFSRQPIHLILFSHPDLGWFILITGPLAILFALAWLAVLTKVYFFQPRKVNVLVPRTLS